VFPEYKESPCPDLPTGYEYEIEGDFHFLGTLWGGGVPYNQSLSGFDASSMSVAVAQIMKFHGFPNSYYWQGMPYFAVTQTDALYISELYGDVKDAIGTVVLSNSKHYASTPNVRNGFVNFTYPSAVVGLYNIQTIVNNLDAHLPVYASGRGDWLPSQIFDFATGRPIYDFDRYAFVIDGYRVLKMELFGTADCPGTVIAKDFMLHINWGVKTNEYGKIIENYNGFYYSVLTADGAELDWGNIHGVPNVPDVTFDKRCIYNIKH
jgi:hypothetical protein